MSNALSLGAIIQNIQFKKQQHTEMVTSLERQIQTVEENLEKMYARFEQHRGALAAFDQVLTDIQKQIEEPAGNPVTDPTAHSDQ